MSKIELGKKYRTRDGRKAVVYAVGLPNTAFPVHGAVLTASGEWLQECWMHDGKYTTVAVDTANDLMEARPRIQCEVWVNVYPDRISSGHLSKQLADAAAGKHRLACIPITIDCEEGEGL